MDLLKQTCILFPIGPTKTLGYQILTEPTLRLLASQFGHVFVFAGSVNSRIKKINNTTLISLGDLKNPKDVYGNEFFSLDTANLQQQFATDYIRLTNYHFVIQVHCNQYFTPSQLRSLKFYLFYMSIFHKSWGWIGKEYQVKNYKTKMIKKLPWVLNLKVKKKINFLPDKIEFNNRFISAKYVYRFPRSVFGNIAPSLTDVLLEYNYEDMKDRYEYYFNRMDKYESIEEFIDKIYYKFSQFKFKQIQENKSGTSYFQKYYVDDSLGNDFIGKFLRKSI